MNHLQDVRESNGKVCQTCKNHSNKPAFCSFGQLMARKAPACADYKEDAAKVTRLSKLNQ